MSRLESYKNAELAILRFFRWDLQLHFFWGFALTLLGQYWAPLYGAGLAVTLVKEALDLWSKKCWCWGDFWCGIAGCRAAFLHSYLQGYIRV
ncbi:hypothetical protein Desaf_1758 [Desulfocurvibacter africanus subsp. africanus str. Walvis Bay]|uniref:Uncharacterized protein n=1 Tax=Desulfocurvibacter africanus subsp. africanus str. Walvis Bay TaxID=690850 RepID=F3Z1Y6_DESAF|nr:hypothetical protein Desaf_1758 [Desulfocurvibacter africanus subsp. africanus str. Walvis Bay]